MTPQNAITVRTAIRPLHTMDPARSDVDNANRHFNTFLPVNVAMEVVPDEERLTLGKIVLRGLRIQS